MTAFTDQPYRAVRRRLIAALGASSLMPAVNALATDPKTLRQAAPNSVVIVDPKTKRKIKLKIRLPAHAKPTALIL